MKYLKRFEGFKVKNITEEDIINCIQSNGYVYATIVKNYPNNDPEQPLKPLSIDEDGLVTLEIDGKEYETELRNIEKCDMPSISEKLSTDLLNKVSDKLKKIGHHQRSKNIKKWIVDRNFNKYGIFDCSIFYLRDNNWAKLVNEPRNWKLENVEYIPLDTDINNDDEVMYDWDPTLKFNFTFKCCDNINENYQRLKIQLSLNLTNEDGEFTIHMPIEIEKIYLNHFFLFNDRKSARKFTQVLEFYQ